MKPRAVLETALYCDDLEDAEAFYVEVLGMAPLAREPGRHVFFRCGEGMLLLFNPDVTEDERAPDSGEPVPVHGARGPGHMAFRADRDELERWKERLESKGVPIERETDWPNGARSIYFRDPAGNSLEFATPDLWGFPADESVESGDGQT